MRLVLRADSHRRAPDGGLEIAASPDTPGREPWQWGLRVLRSEATALEEGPNIAVAHLKGEDGLTSLVALNVDASAVQYELQILDIDAPVRVDRSPAELVAVVIGKGPAIAEGRHVLHALDALILAGDDPLEVYLEPPVTQPAYLALVRLRPAGRGEISWVP